MFNQEHFWPTLVQPVGAPPDFRSRSFISPVRLGLKYKLNINATRRHHTKHRPRSSHLSSFLRDVGCWVHVVKLTSLLIAQLGIPPGGEAQATFGDPPKGPRYPKSKHFVWQFICSRHPVRSDPITNPSVARTSPLTDNLLSFYPSNNMTVNTTTIYY